MKNMLRKTVGVMLILLVLLSSFTACVNDNADANHPNGDAGENHPSGDACENKPSEDKGEGEDNIPEEAPDANQPSEDNTQAEAGIELTNEDSDLISTLVDYLKKKLVHYDFVGLSLEEKINEIKNGEVQPLLIDVDPNNYYFVCCYYDSDRVDEWSIGYRNALEYTWVKYESENSIKEKYNDKNLIYAFQLNKSLIAKNILSGDEDTKMDYFTTLSVEFVDGANVNPANVVSKTFIYLCKSIDNTIYYSYSIKGSSVDRIHCIKLDNQYYYTEMIGFTDPQIGYTDYLENESFMYNLGEYYDYMIKIMITDKYSKTFSENGVYYIEHYGLFEINELVDEVIRK